MKMFFMFARDRTQIEETREIVCVCAGLCFALNFTLLHVLSNADFCEKYFKFPQFHAAFLSTCYWTRLCLGKTAVLTEMFQRFNLNYHQHAHKHSHYCVQYAYFHTQFAEQFHRVVSPLSLCLIWCRLTALFACSRYLHVSGQAYGRPIAGQKEVSGYSSKTQGNLWKAMV